MRDYGEKTETKKKRLEGSYLFGVQSKGSLTKTGRQRRVYGEPDVTIEAFEKFESGGRAHTVSTPSLRFVKDESPFA